MFRRLLSLFLVVGLTQIARPLAEAQSVPDPFPATPTLPIDAKVYTNFDVLRQGTEMKVAILPLRRTKGYTTEPLPVFVRSAPSLVSEAVSTSLELEPADGLSWDAVKSPSSMAEKFHFSNQPIQVFTPAFKSHPIAFRMKVTAAEGAPVGPHLLRGKLTYRIVDDREISALRVLPVEIPIRVVAHNAKAQKLAWTFDQSQAKETTTLVLLSPILIPLGILNSIVSCLFNSCGS